ncbi:MAG: hypothetical protein EXR98_15165 [Gemmataceae bacterium]|nr:hypothetical protein [Gemmataceae bacterium]
MRSMLGLVVAVSIVVFGITAAHSQTNPNEREVKSIPSQFDKVGVWGMDIVFKDPRIIKIKLPTRGERICWYMWYQVINRTGKPEEIAPYFELVTLDNPGIYRDEILITAEDAIRKLEDPNDYQKIKNTVMMSKNAIPPSKEDAFPRAITGVAIWDAGPADPAKRDPKSKELAETTRFSIFVRGFSNGSVEVDSPAGDEKTITQYKTLQLNFKRKGDRFSIDSRDIEFVTPPQWIYRSASRTITETKKDDDKDKK